MSEKYSTQELVNRLSEARGITKKMAEEWVRILPGIIEEGLTKDGYVKIRGLGTFKLKWVDKRIARNMKTGAEVEVPAHSRVIFQAEKKVKELINEEYNKLSYSVIGETSPPVEKGTKPPGKAVIQEEKVPSKMDAVEAPPPGKEKPAIPPTPPGSDKSRKNKNRRYYWIIPLTFLVIVILAIIFYLRNCTHNAEFKKPQPSEQVIEPAGTPEGSAPDTTAVPQTAATEVSPETEAGQPAAVPEEKRQVTKPNYNTPEKTVVTQGEWLFQLAREQYGNPFLWVLIYQANTDKLRNPENIPSGIQLTIPALEGTPRRLSHADSLKVSSGYRLVYEFYLGKDEQKAKEYQQGVINFQPLD